MSVEKQMLRLLAYGQLFLLLLVLLLPHVLRWLVYPWGKVLYAVAGLLCIAQAMALHHALKALETSK